MYVDTWGLKNHYVYYHSGRSEAAEAHKKYLEKEYKDDNVYLVEADAFGDFYNDWNNMEDIGVVVLDLHGNPEYIYTRDHDPGCQKIHTSYLERKDIDTIVMLSCNTGHLDVENNVAEQFLVNNNVGLVISVEGYSVTKNNGVVKVEQTSNGSKTFKELQDVKKGGTYRNAGFVVYRMNNGVIQYSKELSKKEYKSVVKLITAAKNLKDKKYTDR